MRILGQPCGFYLSAAVDGFCRRRRPVRRRKPVRTHASGSRRRGLAACCCRRWAARPAAAAAAQQQPSPRPSSSRLCGSRLLPRGPARLEFLSPEQGGFIRVGAPACHGQLRCYAPRGLRSRAAIRDRVDEGIVALRLRQTATGCEVHERNLDTLGQLRRLRQRNSAHPRHGGADRLHVCCGLGCRWLPGRGTWSGRAAARPRAVHRIKIQPYCPIFPPNRTLCLKFAPAPVWPREAVRALSGQPKGSCHGLRPSGGTAGDRGRPQPKPRSQNAAKMQPKWPCLKLWPHTGQYV